MSLRLSTPNISHKRKDPESFRFQGLRYVEMLGVEPKSESMRSGASTVYSHRFNLE